MHETHADLNLLPALVALLEERHVSRAAERVRLSQPAMSRTLHRLRRLFGDELLVRGVDGYVLTPRAERLQRRLADLTPGLAALFADETFDPATARVTFRLAGTDFAVGALAPRLVGRIPAGSTLLFGAWHDGVLADLERGATDLVFTGVAPPAHLCAELLFDERFVCVVAADHPRVTQALTRAAYEAERHVVVAASNGRQPAVDDTVDRRAALIVAQHSAAVRCIPGTELVATIPERLARDYADPASTRIVPAPAEIRTLAYHMAWHPRLDADPAHRWLRSQIRESVE